MQEVSKSKSLDSDNSAVFTLLSVAHLYVCVCLLFCLF